MGDHWPPCNICSILPKNAAVREHGITNQLVAPEILTVHIDRRNSAVIIRCVVINSLACIAAGGVNRDFVFAVGNLAAAPLLFDRAENVEKLTDAFFFRIARDGIHLSEGDPNKSGRR